jgi:probable rRNA maturation factor
MPTPPDEDPYPPPTSPPLKIEFELIDPLSLLTQQGITKINTWTNAIFTQLSATGSVRAKVVNDQQMADAHQRFSGIPGTTDVLTFDLNDEDNSETKALDTDLIVCADEAARQAQKHNHSTEHEILLYIIHGTLHCLGYNDHTPEDYNSMHTREDQLLTAAGIGPLFDRGTNS